MQTTRGSQYRSSDLTTINLLTTDSRYLPYNRLIEVSHLDGLRNKPDPLPDPLIEPALAIEFRPFARRFLLHT
jgi:hypothetical protein